MQARQLPTSAAAPAAPAAWSLYFPDTAYIAQDRRAMLITELLGALQSDGGWMMLKALQSVQQEYVLPLDYQQLCQLCDSPDLAAALEMQPLEGMACLQAAVHEVRCRYPKPCCILYHILSLPHALVTFSCHADNVLTQQPTSTWKQCAFPSQSQLGRLCNVLHGPMSALSYSSFDCHV